MRKIKYTLPLLPLRGICVFPGMVIHFDVGRPQSIAAVKQAMNNDKMIFLCYQNDITVEDPELEDLAEIGTIAEIHQILNLPDGNIRILVEGVYRGKVSSYEHYSNYAQVCVLRKDDTHSYDSVSAQVLLRKSMNLVEDYLSVYDRLSPEVTTSLLAVDDSGELADIIATNFPLKPALKQEILNEIDADMRLERLNDIVEAEIEILTLEKSIASKTQKSLDENQREYMLREKIKVIHEELGDDETEADIRKYAERLQNRDIPQFVTDKLNEEFERLRRNNPSSQEYGVIQNYIETVIELPWNQPSEEFFDIKKAAEILDRDHYGLCKVKERILEYIAVRSLGGKPKSNIICLVGPPGTGKTSVAKSLAESLGRKYVRISLGGVKNEAEIRGHRKTYIGAMPGRVIDALKNVGVSNPLILFDEIDKMSHDITGDPASALLEVLDPEQNKNFRDNFVELPFDLSDVIFVTTANSLETIPRPLLDRMDIIETESYTYEEKKTIAKKYLMPKQRMYSGLKPSQLKFNDSAYLPLIEGYTKEAGVRELERKISSICRKAARKISEGDTSSVVVSKKSLTDILGNPEYITHSCLKTDIIGVSTGLAWTAVGGDILNIEVNVMSGSGKLELTGNLGDVMKESAMTALSYIRANAFALSINPDFYKTSDIHIHVPEGAVPKDGPSAGITIATAMISALTGRKVRHDTAMTGEVTLRGRVLAIGGLKEKTLAAYKSGIKRIIIPKENSRDYIDLPDVVKNNIEFIFADNMDKVIGNALQNASIKTNTIHSASYIEKGDASDKAVCKPN